MPPGLLFAASAELSNMGPAAAIASRHCAGDCSLHDDAACFGDYLLHVCRRLHVPLLRDLG